MTGPGSSLLDRIVSRKRKEIEELQRTGEPSLEGLESPRDFYFHLKNPGGRLRHGTANANHSAFAGDSDPASSGTFSDSNPASASLKSDNLAQYLPLKRAIISECKKASPSMGLIRPDYDPARIAETYASLGASCLSVLTDEDFFQGHISHLAAARKAGIPVLRKDFLIHRLQINQARAAGADSILLIVRLLSDEDLADLLAHARSLNMEPLVEVHCESELRRACECGARIIGINHRDLDTLEMDLGLSARLAPVLRKLNPEAVLIAESGIEKGQTLNEMSEFADAFLIGTSLMRSNSIEDGWKTLFGS